MTLRTMFVAAAGFLLVLVILTLEIPLAVSLDHRFRAEFEALQLGSAGLLSGAVADEVAHSAGLAVEEEHGQFDIQSAIDSAVVTPGTRTVVVDRHGTVLVDTSEEPLRRLEPGAWPLVDRAFAGVVVSEVEADPTDEAALIVAVPVVEGGQVVGAVRLAAPLDSVEAAIGRVRLRFRILGLLALFGGMAMIWTVANAVTKPLSRLERAAARLGAGEHTARAEPEGPVDVVSLGRSFNTMADSLVAAAHAQRDFVANASHQLRTPLTGLRLRLENLAADRPGEGGDRPDDVAYAFRELDRMESMVNDLLALARATSGEAPPEMVSLEGIAEDTVERWAHTAERTDHRLARIGDGGTAWVNREHVELILDNLVDNAIRYTPPGTTITIASSTTPTEALLAVNDDGPGIPLSDRKKAFDRFYRGSNRRKTTGSGLGLAIVAEVASKWGGEVRLANGRGTTVEVAFPRAVPDSRLQGIPIVTGHGSRLRTRRGVASGRRRRQPADSS